MGRELGAQLNSRVKDPGGQVCLSTNTDWKNRNVLYVHTQLFNCIQKPVKSSPESDSESNSWYSPFLRAMIWRIQLYKLTRKMPNLEDCSSPLHTHQTLIKGGDQTHPDQAGQDRSQLGITALKDRRHVHDRDRSVHLGQDGHIASIWIDRHGPCVYMYVSLADNHPAGTAALFVLTCLPCSVADASQYKPARLGQKILSLKQKMQTHLKNKKIFSGLKKKENSCSHFSCSSVFFFTALVRDP